MRALLASVSADKRPLYSIAGGATAVKALTGLRSAAEGRIARISGDRCGRPASRHVSRLAVVDRLELT
jgi:hypothetical protein